jgi:trigger factor
MAAYLASCYNTLDQTRGKKSVPKVETELRPDREATLKVEVEPERVERALKLAAARLSRQISIPGFRKGKAPYHVILRHIGEEAVYDEALEELGPEVYAQALEEADLHPYGPGSVNNVSFEPLVLTFSVPLKPLVELGDYRAIRLPFEMPEITNAEVEKMLEDMRDDEATLLPVEHPLKMGEIGTFDILATVPPQGEEDQPERLIDRKATNVLIEEETTYPLPGFSEKVEGMSAGETRTFDLEVDEDFVEEEHLKGAIAHFEVTCSKVWERELPPLDDEFAKGIGDYDSLLELRAGVRKKLEETALREARANYANQVLGAIVEQATIEYPQVMLEEWLDDVAKEFEDRLREGGLTLDDYIRIKGISRDEIRKELRPAAEQRLRRALVLGTVVEAEHLEVSQDEIGDEIETMILSFGDQAALARQLMSGEDSKRSIASRLLTQKAIDRLIEIARGEAPELPEEPITQPQAEPVAPVADPQQTEGIDQ